MPIIEQAVKGDSEFGVQAQPDMPRAAVTRRKSIEEIAAAHRARFPDPITAGPLAVDIVRRDRDAR